MSTRFVLVAALVACTRPVDLVSTPRDAGSAEDEAATVAGEDAAAAPGDEPPPTTGSTVPSVHCSSSARVFVLDASGNIFTFDPTNDVVAPLGTFQCTPSAKPIAIGAIDEGAAYVVTDIGTVTVAAAGDAMACKEWNKVPALPTTNGAALAMVGSLPYVYYATDQSLFRTPLASAAGTWTSMGSIDASDHFRALVGTGDGRLFAVLSPSTGAMYRVASVDPNTAKVGATTLVPTAFTQDPETQAGFALWGSLLLVITVKAVTRYDFATGATSQPEILTTFASPIIAAASPPCASAL